MNPTLRSLSGSSTVVWKLVQYKWWRTNMASLYISTPTNHSFIEFLTFPGLFSVFYSVQSPHVKSSFGQTLPECRQVLHGASLCFPGLCPVQATRWKHQDSQSHMNTDDKLDQTEKLNSHTVGREPTSTCRNKNTLMPKIHIISKALRKTSEINRIKLNNIKKNGLKI